MIRANFLDMGIDELGKQRFVDSTLPTGRIRTSVENGVRSLTWSVKSLSTPIIKLY